MISNDLIAKARAYLAGDSHDYPKCRSLLAAVLAVLPAAGQSPEQAQSETDPVCPDPQTRKDVWGMVRR